MERVLPAAVIPVIQSSIDYVYSFQPYVEPTLVLVPGFVNTQVEKIAEIAGQDVETTEYLLGMLICYPLGLIMTSLPYGKIRHIFSFILGAFLLQFTLGVQWIHQLITSLVAYAMFLILPAKLAKLAVPGFVMTYVTLGHLHRQFTNYLGWDMDFTGAQMVIVIKLYSLAYNLYDGEVLKAGGDVPKASKKCAPFALSKVPGIIEFLGYTFCFSNVLAGPAYEYKIYADACDGLLMYDKNGKAKGPIPSNVWPTLKPFLLSFVCLGLFVAGNGAFPILDPSDPQNSTPVVLTEEMLSRPWIKRYLYAWVSLFFIRQKYYFAWKNAEGANNIWYAGFEGFDAEGKAKGWENANNIDIVAFETAPNLKTLSGGWNKKTANWLARYVYMRTNGSLVATYGMSAFWHGFYPGYYMFFLSVPVITMCERLGKKKLSSRFPPGKWTPWGIVCILATSFVVEYMVMPFQLLAWDWGFTYWKSQFFFGHILCVIFFVVVGQFPSPKKKEN
mmetsp:Transcript_36085/g.44163  ORF Transcript_36085/g.44163 Transcript_36085/m.44163 type:complete len:502 (+) Transcript_36085:148-1653(+)|eukprot:CAMPEP_0172490090 /NCGR_PEP_ID=MMETSP1066-20121228/20439_1 /TAXON_ID=671091 /ORGANISM="Coscinodiscus wailesii, Strain CCMP2513" /LENGTH=501 /DNA_ID=CAMNT_0013258395 /DNA_START=148 /DNA_END=1653 /DNA_ORIENTATION=+